jgi:hypothetical protein
MPAVSVIGQRGAGPPNFRVHAGQIAGHPDKARIPLLGRLRAGWAGYTLTLRLAHERLCAAGGVNSRPATGYLLAATGL